MGSERHSTSPKMRYRLGACSDIVVGSLSRGLGVTPCSPSQSAHRTSRIGLPESHREAMVAPLPPCERP
jgi:hypothetical protein